MLASLLTTVFFSLSVIFAARSSKILGSSVANLGRIVLATVLLGIWAHRFGYGLQGPGMPWFFLSGVIGFGLGDMALFGALSRIGPRLSILLTQCLAAPIAAAVEWLWLGTSLHFGEMVAAAVILAGVALALAPDHGWTGDPREFRIGVLFGIGSALGQSLGAVLSRKAGALSALAGLEIDGGTAAYQRILGGVLMTAIGIAVLYRVQGGNFVPTRAAWRAGWPFVIGNALAGPTVGVACYQWALTTTPSGIVLPIVATSPLVTMLLAYFIDRQPSTRRAIIGGALAVLGAIALRWVQTG